MRQRYFWAPAGAARWPDDVGGQNLPPFNWVKIDNRGAGDVQVGLANPSASLVDFLFTVKAGKMRVLNVAGPDNNPQGDQDTDYWAQELHILAAGATTIMIEISDKPIVDMIFTI